MSTRKITDNQFSDKTTIDSNRLDEAIDDVTERINNVQKGDIKQRFIESQLVSSWMVCRGYGSLDEEGHAGIKYQYPFSGVLQNENFAPWLRIANTTNDEVDGKDVTNPYRIKGAFNPYFAVNGTIDNREEVWDGLQRNSTQYVWTQSHQQEGDKSSILNAVNFQMIFDGRYTSNAHLPAVVYGDEFQYSWVDVDAAGFLDSSEYAVGLPLKDMHVVVDVDFPLDAEERKLNSKLVGRHLFRVDAEMISFYQIPTDDVLGGPALGTHAMWPNVSTAVTHEAALTSLSINLRDLDIPIPSGARLRWTLVIPLYGDAHPIAGAVVQVGPWAFDPMARFSWGSTLTLLEEIRG